MELHINTSKVHDAIEIKAHHTDYDGNTFTFTLEHADEQEQILFFCSQMFLSMVCRCNGNTNPVEVIVNNCKTGTVLNLKDNSALSAKDFVVIKDYMKNTTNVPYQYEEELQREYENGSLDVVFSNLEQALPQIPDGYEPQISISIEPIKVQSDQDERSFDGPYGYIQ